MKIKLLLLLILLSGCVSQWTPEAQVALAERQISWRAYGLVMTDPNTGITGCLCYITYDRNNGPGPTPPAPQPK